ncbi:MAG: Lrp/AsnC ligand binding domain-containing protein [Gammaproteobacteria bacterium]|nr:Lrp/AsnC ligand binding domain-containing protein [Gammaproteobacteria bacterium]
MQTIFVQLKCDLGKAYEVAAELVERDSVSEVYSISGQYDLLAKCYLDDAYDIGHYVEKQIHSIAGIRDTHTTIAFNAFT